MGLIIENASQTLPNKDGVLCVEPFVVAGPFEANVVDEPFAAEPFEADVVDEPIAAEPFVADVIEEAIWLLLGAVCRDGPEGEENMSFSGASIVRCSLGV